MNVRQKNMSLLSEMQSVIVTIKRKEKCYWKN